MRLLLASLLGLALLSGCASSAPQEAAAGLQYSRTASIDIKWRMALGDGSVNQYLRLEPAVEGDTVYAADPAGSVTALELAEGDELWRIDLNEPINAGVTLAGEQLLLVTRAGFLVSLNTADGSEQWRVVLPSEAVSAPSVDDSRVYVHTVDGHITALNLADGSQIWSYESALPVLTVRGTSSPLVLEPLVVVGLASGKVIALDKQLGIPRWEVRLASPDGRSELERLVDIDGEPQWNNGRIYAASYHGKVAAISLQGETQWQEDGSSYTHPELALGNLYLSLDNDHIQAYDQENGAKVWQQVALEGLKIGQVSAYKNWLVVADNDGNLYVLNQINGELVTHRLVRFKPLHVSYPNQTAATQWRTLRGKHMGIRSQLISTEQGLLVYTNAGELLLVDIQPKKSFF